MYSFSWNASKFLLAFVFVFVTTADDSVWLVPMIATERYNPSARFQHALVFVCGLQLACIFSWSLCLIFGELLITSRIHIFHSTMSAQLAIQVLGALLTWLIAIVLFAKKMIKKCRKSRSNKENDVALITVNRQNPTSYNSIEAPTSKENEQLIEPIEADSFISPPNHSSKGANLWFVFSMTLVGAADEIMCFPPLLLGNTFSFLELSTGCLAVCISLIIILLAFYAMFQPVFHALDQIPLYVVVAVLAAMQTVDMVFEISE